MASTESQLEEIEDVYSMVPISLSTPPFEELPVTTNNDDQKPQFQIKTTVILLRILLVTIKEKFMAIKRLFEDNFLHNFCFSSNSDRPRAYQVWPGNNVCLCQQFCEVVADNALFMYSSHCENMLVI